MPKRIEIDGQIHEFPDDFTDADITSALDGGSRPAEPRSSGGATLAATALRAAPGATTKLTRIAGRFAANHPALTQKVIGAGVSTGAGAIGGAVGGVPGAVVGASIRGVTPAQTTIRRVAGQMAGEAPAVADDAAKALGIQNYAKETSGIRLKPTDIIRKPEPANALEHYANSMERGILRLYGPNGEVVSGPSAVTETSRAARPMARRALSGLQRIARVAAPLSGAMGMTDFAQAVEPNRRDIGVMGIGRTPTADTLNMTPADFEQFRVDNPPLINMLAKKGSEMEQYMREALMNRLRGTHP